MKLPEQLEAQRLRRDQGLPLGTIAIRLGVSKSSVSRWTRDIELSPCQVALLQTANPAFGRQLAGQESRRQSAREQRERAQRHGRELARQGELGHATGCMLYWAEGSKRRNTVVMTNSDPDLLRLFVDFLRGSYCVPDGGMTLSLNCYLGNGLSLADIENWWMERLRLPRSCLRSPTVNRPKGLPFRRNRLRYGTARVVVHSTFIVQSIYGAIQEYAGIERADWLN